MSNGTQNYEADSGSTRFAVLDQGQWDCLRKKYQLTQRELQIAQRICRGATNDQIAGDLHISSGTVKTHLRNIYRKTWVHSKVAMLLRFLEEAAQPGPESDSGEHGIDQTPSQPHEL